ncbi:hypothetical protein BGW36DRAFT_61167 [Talaromyces proteolyticus]|uniref:Sequence orphan n=1 Tax=Talaromyces proteolyticus TaxID=1131652 RepID=A0AAD4PV50_9EURO|nr:uncharacterized protein BGW36DRAFT_61167 [Talaromyces proteolyticus]KAH8690879.1 hypothetical protein BGW36DRAFT_61167 [Talaromyces proteolyticus]
MSRDASANSVSPKEQLSAAVPARVKDTAKQWNTRSLGLRLGADAASAAVAGALICPLITIIDRAIMEKASKGISIQHTLTSGLKSIVMRPAGFFFSAPFLLIYTLYSGTYLTANTIDTVTSTLRNQPFSTVTPGTAKFLTTTTVNMSICVYKDARFAKLFGPSSSQCHPTGSSSAAAATVTKAPQIPKMSYSLFCLRDSITIFASFNVPALIAPQIPDFVASTPNMKAAIAQFSCPALMQFVSTPMHLLGLDLYNRQPPGGLSWRDRLSRIRRDYIVSSFARMGKIVPAYGVGGVVNVRLRAALMEKLQLQDDQKRQLSTV